MAPYPECAQPATIGSTDPSEAFPYGGWYSRCGCETVTCAEGTYEDACNGLAAHRALPPEG